MRGRGEEWLGCYAHGGRLRVAGTARGFAWRGPCVGWGGFGAGLGRAIPSVRLPTPAGKERQPGTSAAASLLPSAEWKGAWFAGLPGALAPRRAKALAGDPPLPQAGMRRAVGAGMREEAGGRSRFPKGMTERKATATAKAGPARTARGFAWGGRRCGWGRARGGGLGEGFGQGFGEVGADVVEVVVGGEVDEG